MASLHINLDIEYREQDVELIAKTIEKVMFLRNLDLGEGEINDYLFYVFVV